MGSYLFWKENRHVIKDGYKKYYFKQVDAYFNPVYSYAELSARTDDALAREQFRFDLCEYYGRSFRDYLVYGVQDTTGVRNRTWEAFLADFNAGETSPAVVAGALKKSHEEFDPRAFSWQEKTTSIIDLQTQNHYIPSDDSYYSFAPSLTLSFGFQHKSFFTTFEITSGLQTISSKLTKNSIWNSQMLTVGFNCYKTERFRASAIAGGGIAGIQLTHKSNPSVHKYYENASWRMGAQAEYVVASFYHFDKTWPWKNEILLFTRLGTDTIEGIFTGYFTAGVKLTTIPLKIISL